MNEEEILSGLAHVRANPDCDVLDGCKGAYVKVFSKATKISAFKKHVKCALEDMGLTLIDLEDMGPSEDIPDITHSDATDYMMDADRGLIFGEFQIYENDDS